jgi:lipid II:glycine glycyltransferase (peptidoglycan interpeptide bridge formation enzyme)
MEIIKIDTKQDWDTALAKFKYTTHFLAWEWGEFEKSLGNTFETWGVYEGDTIVGLLPLNFLHAKRGKYLHLRHGPLINFSNEELLSKIVEFIKQKASQKGAHLVRISPLIDNSQNNKDLLSKHGFMEATTHSRDAELTVVIDLEQSEEQILSDMRKNTRNLIKKAEKIGVEIKRVSDPSLFDDFLEIYNDTVNRQKWTAYSGEYIKNEFEIFSKVNRAEMFVAYYKGIAVAASIFIIHRNQVIYHHSGSLSDFRNLPSMYLLHWEAIKYFKQKGLEIYNFWGVSPENAKKHPWSGLSLFKRGFTKKEMEFIHAHDLVIHPMGHLTRLYEYLEAKIRGYKNL